MSFVKNHKESTSTERKLYTGLCEMEVVAINPNGKELSTLLGGAEVKEPVYTTTTEEGATQTRVNFWLQNKEHNIIVPMAIFVEGKKRVSQKGLNEYINRKVQVTWGESLEEVAKTRDWFDTETAREAYVGETTLYDFICKYTNAATGQDDSDLEFEDIKDIIKGDVSEIVTICSTLGKTIKVLLGVRDGKYQAVFTNAFMKGSSTGTSQMEKQAFNADYPWKADFQGTLDFKVWSAPEAPESNDEVASSSEVTNLF